MLFTCSAGEASSAPGAVSDAMLCPLPTPCPWICPQSPLSVPISRQHFTVELLGVQYLGCGCLTLLQQLGIAIPLCFLLF